MTDEPSLSSPDAAQAAPTNGGTVHAEAPPWSPEVARELRRIFNCLDSTREQIGALELMMVLGITITILTVTGAALAIRKAKGA